MKEFSTLEETGLDPVYWAQSQKWLDRGDGMAIYENQDIGHLQLGHRQFVSFGSTAAQLESDEPPQRLPDIGNRINWRYQLIGFIKHNSSQKEKNQD